MLRAAGIAAVLLALATGDAAAQAVVVSDSVDDASVTVYRDPDRGDGAMNLDYLNGFALISETRTIALATGENTIRFEGVAEGMVAVSAIVTGLPQGVVQKNRDTAILSPASLVDGTLGNRVTLRRTDPATGRETSVPATVRSVANRGLVVQTPGGFEALRCSGLPETLVFGRVPPGLSATPVLTVNTLSPSAQTVEVTLTYLASGFDWSANYVATMEESGKELGLTGWLTLANGNGQSFDNAAVLAIAGTLNVEQDYASLVDPVEGPPLRLECYPIGSTAAGSPVESLLPPPPPPPPDPMAAMADRMIVVTGTRRSAELSKAPVTADLEQLGDLKLYRVPFRSTVAANAQKQVAFTVKDRVEIEKFYVGWAQPGSNSDAQPTQIELRTVNREKQGLGVPLPSGGVAVFEPAGGTELLLAEDTIRDYPVGADVMVEAGQSRQVLISSQTRDNGAQSKWISQQVTLTNANPFAVDAEIAIGRVGQWRYRKVKGRVLQKDGKDVWAVRVPAHDSRTLLYDARNAYDNR